MRAARAMIRYFKESLLTIKDTDRRTRRITIDSLIPKNRAMIKRLAAAAGFASRSIPEITRTR